MNKKYFIKTQNLSGEKTILFLCFWDIISHQDKQPITIVKNLSECFSSFSAFESLHGRFYEMNFIIVSQPLVVQSLNTTKYFN